MESERNGQCRRRCWLVTASNCSNAYIVKALISVTLIERKSPTTSPVRSQRFCATRTGWHSASTFVLPDRVIDGDNIWFQSHIRVAAYAQAGDFKEWKRLIAARAIGNRFLLFAVSFSLCG